MIRPPNPPSIEGPDSGVFSCPQLAQSTHLLIERRVSGRILDGEKCQTTIGIAELLKALLRQVFTNSLFSTTPLKILRNGSEDLSMTVT
jgi:hypothetical protein